MKQEIKPQESARVEAFELWMSSPMPMVTLTKTFDVSNIVKISKRNGIKFNALMCWCIINAASKIVHFFTVPEQGRLYRYDRLAINVIVNNSKGGINSCDIPFYENITQFIEAYNALTSQTAERCKSSFLEDCMVVGTSAMVYTELDSNTPINSVTQW